MKQELILRNTSKRKLASTKNLEIYKSTEKALDSLPLQISPQNPKISLKCSIVEHH